MSGGILPTINAVLNSASAACLIVGFGFIRKKNILAHQRSMIAAFALSCLFLVTYVIHHAEVGSVPFRGTGAARWIYFSILIPHVTLAAAVVPLALLTIYRGWTNRIERHRRIARITLPIWLYVSISGVFVYLMLYQWF